MDVVGLTTVYNIVSMYLEVSEEIAPYHYKAMTQTVKKYSDKGKLGVASREGFYKC